MLLIRTLKSSTFRLALVCVILFSTLVFALLGYVYWATTGYVRDRSDRDIWAERVLLVQAYGTSGRTGLISLINQRIAEPNAGDSVYLLCDPSFAVLAGNLKAWPSALTGSSGWAEIAVAEAMPAKADWSPVRAHYETQADGSHLLVGRATDDIGEFVGAIRVALAGGAALTFVLAAVAGIFVTRRTVGRIEAINATTREIMRSGLRRRIPLRGTEDEWDQLAQNLNAMLDRIEELVRDVKQVSDNVAHGLRTPLTRLQGRLEKAYHHKLEAERYQELVGDAIHDLNGILQTFASLLRISQIEARDPRSVFRVVDLGEVAGEVAELFDAAAEERGGRIRLTRDERAPVLGGRDLLFEAISNIIDNAIKYGGGDVLVETRTDGRGAMLMVADRGPGIPPEEFEQVFKRFYRLDRSRGSPGNGLGLSLVAAVARQHGAVIELADNAPGLRVEVRFPRVKVP